MRHQTLLVSVLLGLVSVNALFSGRRGLELVPSEHKGASELLAGSPKLSTSSLTAPPSKTLHTRATNSNGALICASDSLCIDGSCCGPQGICGYGPTYCGKGCQSQCTATSLCGQYSENGNVSCGMKLCCSGAGWCGATTDYCTSGNGGCQQGFGSCQVKTPLQCDAKAASATKRTIAYYQGSNVYSGRSCDTVAPNDIKTAGYTHLYWAFAEIDPVSFQIVPGDARDPALYPAFTALKSPQLQIWISVGGFDFTSDNLQAWSQMVATARNRKVFISSLVTFMDKYGFQGIDLDWEYPVDPTRGGAPNDMKNLIQLLADMRATFGHKYGISVTLAPDIWYLQRFDAKGLLANADWLGFMSYDLHGIWDASVPNVGKKVYGQTDMYDISRDTTPLWFDLSAADMARVNFGLAYYGRGYTLADKTCMKADGSCAWTAGSKPGPCTAQEGILSYAEISRIIQTQKLTPTALDSGHGGSTMKQIVWNDQWVGYDDPSTIQKKIEWASSHCFGGTMAWSIDLLIDTGKDEPPTVNPVGKNPYGPDRSVFYMPVLCDSRSDAATDFNGCDYLVYNLAQDGGTCDNTLNSGEYPGCTIITDPSIPDNDCAILLCGAAQGATGSCGMMAAGLQELASTCGPITGKIGGSVTIRADDSQHDQTIRAISYSLLGGGSKNEIASKNVSVAARSPDHAKRDSIYVDVPGTTITLQQVGYFGQMGLRIGQNNVNNQIARLASDFASRLHDTRVHAAVPYTFQDTIDLDFMIDHGRDNSGAFRPGDVGRVAQVINDMRNNAGNPGVFGVFMFRTGNTQVGGYLGSALWQYNSIPSSNADAVPLQCQYCSTPAELASKFDSSLNLDPETGEIYDYEYGPAPAYGGFIHGVEIKPTGGTRPYTVTAPTGQSFQIRSLRYPNGDNGAYLLRINPNAGYYDRSDPNDCTNTDVTDDSEVPDSAFVTEHPTELGYLAELLTSMLHNTNLPFSILEDQFTQDYSQWDLTNPSPRVGSPLNRIFNIFGSTGNPAPLFNAERTLNSMKSRVWRGVDPVSDASWNENQYDDIQSPDACEHARGALSEIQLIIAVFSYLNDHAVDTSMGNQFTQIAEELTYFAQRATIFSRGPTIPDLGAFSVSFLHNTLIARIEHVETWVEGRLVELQGLWQQAVTNGVTEASDILGDINHLLAIVRCGLLVNGAGYPEQAPPSRVMRDLAMARVERAVLRARCGAKL